MDKLFNCQRAILSLNVSPEELNLGSGSTLPMTTGFPTALEAKQSNSINKHTITRTHGTHKENLSNFSVILDNLNWWDPGRIELLANMGGGLQPPDSTSYPYLRFPLSSSSFSPKDSMILFAAYRQDVCPVCTSKRRSTNSWNVIPVIIILLYLLRSRTVLGLLMPTPLPRLGLPVLPLH